jgi:hypothetical protein
MKSSSTPAPYRAAWTLLVVALVVCVGFWASTISNTFSAERAAAPIPVPVATTAPQIATVYSNVGPPNPSTLCAEISPTPRRVTVESTAGVVIETVTCKK